MTLRDPDQARRWATLLVMVMLAWPLLVLAEFKPWALFDERSLRATSRFLAQFITPRADSEFLTLLARDTWRTVAIATAGMAGVRRLEAASVGLEKDEVVSSVRSWSMNWPK